MSAIQNPDAEFSYGFGHINPAEPIDPSLVYDVSERDYRNFIYSIGTDMGQILGDEEQCGSPNDLNYQSIMSSVGKAEFSRMVTNVGRTLSTYQASITSPSNLNIIIIPRVLASKT